MNHFNNPQQQNPLAGLNLYDPSVRQWVMQNLPQYAGLLPQYQQPMNPFGFNQPQFPQQAFPQPVPYTSEAQSVLALFEEFSKTEDGKVLVSAMGKFNSYCQSVLNKQNVSKP